MAAEGTKENPLAEQPESDNPVIAFFQKVKKLLDSTGETTKLLFAVTVAIGLVLFLATAQGESVGAARVVTIALVATLASMGAATVPSAGLVLLVMIMDTVNVPITELFSVIIAIDWLNDRIETMTNVLGDSIAAGIIQNYYSKLLISGTTDQVKRASVLITGQVDESFKKDSEKLMKRRVSTMSVADQKAIESATGLSVTDEYLTPSTNPEATDLADIQEEPDQRKVSNPVAPRQSNPLYDGVGEP